MTLSNLALILFTVTLSACAQLALKLAVSQKQVVSALDADVSSGLFAAALSPLVWLGTVIYVLSFALWLFVLSKVDLSVAYPFVGISFVVTMAFGGMFLDEQISASRLIGTLLIVAGCVFVGKSA